MTPPPSSVQHRTSPHVIIIGAGPAGSLLALLLARHGATVSIYDYRPDIRQHSPSGQTRQRSINLAISTRGISALNKVGLSDALRALAVPMHGRLIHPLNSTPQFQPYGQPYQYLLSVSRVRLTALLLDSCDENDSITLQFGCKCLSVDLHAPSVTILNPDATQSTVTATLVVGADGSFSKVRTAMAREGHFDFSQSFIPTLYKEFTMSTHRNNPSFPPNGLHIWPHGEVMLIALPNDSSGSFTCTLFIPQGMLEKLIKPDDVRKFFLKHFPDAVPALPTLEEDFFANPAPSLVTIRCNPYHYGSTAVIIGDAAHAIVPFYGQGCNAALEDCVLLSDAIAQHGWTNLDKALSSYSTSRKPDADAIADLALEHYHDMSSNSAKPWLVLKRRLEILANKVLPQSLYLPLYSMISFSNIPYSKAVAWAKTQERVIGLSAGLLLATTTTAAIAFAIRRTDLRISITK